MKKRSLLEIIRVFISLPKTLYVNIVLFGIRRGGKLPIFVYYNTKILEIHKGCVDITNSLKPMMIKFGINGSNGVVENGRATICLEKGSKIIFHGRAHFAAGCSIRNSGLIVCGDNFTMNKNSFLSCFQKIDIGNDVTAGWNVNIRDSDGHHIIYGGEKKPLSKTVSIGNHVWICSYAHILKGCTVKDNSVIAYRSLVTKAFSDENLLIGGSPAKIITRDINWEY